MKRMNSIPAKIRRYRGTKQFNNIRTAVCTVISSLMQAFVIQTFVLPAELLSGGFTGVAILVEMLAQKIGIYFPTSVGMLCLNIPVALFCARSISRRFVLFSSLNVLLTSLFLQLFHFRALFTEPILDVVFGGFLGGMAAVMALRGNASGGGTDFIALYVSNKTGKSIWNQVFAGNCLLFFIFGFLFGWINAAYSILYQYVATRTVSAFHRRYDRLTLQITTTKAEPIIKAYTEWCPHGISCARVIGGYSGREMYLLTTVLSSYEEHDAVELIRRIDPNVIINVMKTENFYGKFAQPKIE